MKTNKGKKRYYQLASNTPGLDLKLELERPPSVRGKFLSGEYRVAVYGLGHVGAPIASCWLRAGVTVMGIDKSKRVMENAKNGITHIPEPGVNEALGEGIKNGKFMVCEDAVKASEASKLKMICVPVLIKNNKADLAAVKDAALSIGKGLKKGDIVSFHPTVPPLTTEKFLIPLLEKSSNLREGGDFFVIYNPERIYEGRAIFDIEDGHPGIVAGTERHSLELAKELFSLIFRKGVITVSSIKTAEAEKLFEGIYRDVNIALANELSVLCETLGIDFWEAQNAANSQPFCHIHKPGIGVGGACIPVYPRFVLEVAGKNRVDCRLTRTGRALNDRMPHYALSKALKMMPRKDLKSSKVTILGLAFRGGVSDTRLSPTYILVKRLLDLKVTDIIIHDPVAKDDVLESKHKALRITNDLESSIKNRDLIILATDHSDYAALTKEKTGKTPIYDGRGILDPESFDRDLFRGIGRPIQKQQK